MMRPGHSHQSQRGVSLIELILVIVIVSIGVAGFMSVINLTTGRSSDPLLRVQANAIAESYLEEAMLKSFCDPSFPATDCPTDCTNRACTVGVGGACGGINFMGGEAGGRAEFDDVCDYDALGPENPTDQTGTALASLTEFNVTVSVVDNDTLNGLNGTTGRVVRIDVNVTHATHPDINVTLSGYRTNFD